VCLDSGAKLWIPERSAMRLREADLNVLSELGKQGLEWRLEAEPPLRPDNPALALAEPDQVCLSSIGHGWSQAGLRNASATMPGDLRAGSERSWIDDATFAQVCSAASPCPSAVTVRSAC
jgi:hypothetical protein